MDLFTHFSKCHKFLTRLLAVLLLPIFSMAQPANDLCGAATVIISSPTCNNLTAQTLLAATATAGVPNNCGNAGSADVWYQFIATSTQTTITLSALGTGIPSITNAGVRIQVLSGTCGAWTNVLCVSGTSWANSTSTPLIIGNTYYVRIYTNSNAVPTGPDYGFSICMVDPPANDNCSNATLLTSNTNWNNLTGQTLFGATATAAVPGSCGNAASADVWYRFVAQSTTPTIALTSLGTGTPSITAAGIRVQLLSGTCGAWTSLSCVSATTLPTYALPPLVIGTTYYIRIATNSATVPVGPDFGFSIAVIDPPANDDCANATLLASGATCTNLNGQTLLGSNGTVGVPNNCGNASSADVWYQFVAQSNYPTITLGSVGTGTASLTSAGVRMQLLSGTCGTWTSLSCVSATTLSASGLPPLVIGNTYYIRIYTNTATLPVGPDFGFSICVVDPPVNDECANSILLTSGVSCVNTTGTVAYAAVSNAIIPSCNTPRYDVWYHFVAQRTNPTITLSNTGITFSPVARIQLLSGNCAGFTSVGCSNTGVLTYTAAGLTVGATYYIRVFSSTNPLITSNAGFDICITDPALPANDACINAITLSSGLSCTNVAGTLLNATTTAAVPNDCGAIGAADVWYSFIAQTAFPTITMSNIANAGAFANAGTRMQLLSGSCGAWTSIACVSGTGNANVIITPGGTGLTVGAIYYLRIYSNSAVMSGTAWGFNLCITNPAKPRYGNSYVNISKRTSGGVVEQGDTLEVRMTIHYTSGILYNTRYLDNIPSNTQMLTGSTDSIRVLTNEGLTYQNFTPGSGDDPATYVASPGPGQYNIRLNLGFAGSSPGPSINNSETDLTGSGEMLGSNRPRGGSGLLFATSFRVVVTGSPGNTISLGTGKFLYRFAPGGVDSSLITTPYQILISTPQNLCANATGVNAAQEFGGTFGSGNTLNRPTNLTFPIPSYTYVNASAAQAVGDGQYAIVKNMSPRDGTNRNANRVPNCTGPLPSADSCIWRMFNGHWDIDGDHTGTNNAIGNIPPAASDPGGYMLMVNADYVASETYRQTLSGLCPNTFYEFSAWIRNICPTCGVDSIGTQTYRPGVKPNLTFVLDDVDRYSTGEVDTIGWQKKGFVFKTGPSQTSMTFSIRNNGQGGGGNDWVLDDVSIATCLPNMSYSPSLSPNVCTGNSLTINDTVRSYFNNYSYYQWQRSTDDGVSWTDVASPGSTTPILNGNGLYEYITAYTIPSANTALSDSGNLYRVIVATTNANLSSPSCQVTDGVSIINLNVLNCGPILSTDLLSFTGKLINGKGQLSWTTSKEDIGLKFTVEKSPDGRDFQSIGVVNSYNNQAVTNRYNFTDPEPISNKAWYRIAMSTPTNRKKLSTVVQLMKDLPDFDFGNVINPFNNSLRFDIMISKGTILTIELLDMNGKLIRKEKQPVYAGVNSLSLTDTGSLPQGVYTLRITNNDKALMKRVMKKN